MLFHQVIYHLVLGSNSDKELTYNLDTFQKVSDNALTTANDLIAKKNEVLTALKELRSGWKTPAG